MTLQQRYNQRYGVYKGLVTRWTNAGYNIQSDYVPPKRITEGSIRRLEREIEEIRRQKDVQEARVEVEFKRARDLINSIINQYLSGERVAHVGFQNYAGAPRRGDAHYLVESSVTDLRIILRNVADKANTKEKRIKFANNVQRRERYFADVIENVMYAAYKARTAKWGKEEHFANWIRMKSAFEAELSDGI